MCLIDKGHFKVCAKAQQKTENMFVFTSGNGRRTLSQSHLSSRYFANVFLRQFSNQLVNAEHAKKNDLTENDDKVSISSAIICFLLLIDAVKRSGK
jgi:hypothetical protein